MSTIIDRLLGRKKRTSVTISDELATQAAALADARNRIVAAKAAREAALDSLNKTGLKAATEEQTDAENDVALAERAILALQAAHEEALAVEAREAFRREVSEYENDAEALSARLLKEYPSAASVIAAIMSDLASLQWRAHAIEQRGQKLGETVRLCNPEGVRQNARAAYFATWPNPNGIGVIQGPVEDAPSGAIKWVDGEPSPARDEVNIIVKHPEPLVSLLDTIGDLPPLNQGEPYFFVRSAARRAPSIADMNALGEALRRIREQEQPPALPVDIFAALP